MPLEDTTLKPVVLPETSETIPVTPVVEQNKKPWIKIAILLIVILLGCAGLVFAGMEIQKRQTIPAPASTPEAITTSTLDRVADWKTYSKPNAPFTFKYPSELAFFVQNTVEASGNKNVLIQIQNFDHQKPSPSDFDTNPDYFIFWIAGAATGEDFNLRLEDSEMGLSKIGRKKITIDGIEAYEGTGIIHNQSGIKKVMFKYKDWIFDITGRPSYSKNLIWFDQIISTIKFIDNSNAQIPGYKTYEAEGLYKISYPKDYYFNENKDNKRQEIMISNTEPLYSAISDNLLQLKVDVLYNTSETQVEEYIKRNSSSLVKIEKTDFQGIEGKVIISNDNKFFTYYLLKDKNLYTIDYSIQGQRSEETGIRQEAEKILSTFKFLE